MFLYVFASNIHARTVRNLYFQNHSSSSHKNLSSSLANSSWSDLWSGSFTELKTNLTDLSQRLDQLSMDGDEDNPPDGFVEVSGDDEHFYYFSNCIYNSISNIVRLRS